MTDGAKRIVRVYLTLTLLSTLAASFIWGVNTLFLLDAGLSATTAFTVNAFYTAGQVIFEIPTGVVADTRGRRTSYLLGAVTLLVATLLYVWMWQIEGPFWGWALSSIVIGLGFTFFSGAVEAWLVDALAANGYDEDLESVFARGQVVLGIAMLTGSLAGGVIAQVTNLSVPYWIRAGLLAVVTVVAWVEMRDEGFTPHHGKNALDEMRSIATCAIEIGWGTRPVRWLLLTAPFTMGLSVFAFYGMQPYLLELYGDDGAFAIAGLAASVAAAMMILGGVLVPHVRRRFTRRTDMMLVAAVVAVISLIGIGLTSQFWVALFLLACWALTWSVLRPVRQSYLNGIIPSEQRATVLSVDAQMESVGGLVSQPLLGRAADVWSFSTAYIITGIASLGAIPFLLLARREKAESDPIDHAGVES